jgi:hypothetical protein
MAEFTINNLPLDADGHQFWVSSVDYSGNENVIGMSSTGYIQMPPLSAPLLSNSNIYTQESDQQTAVLPGEWNRVTPYYPGVIVPVIVTGVYSTDNYITECEVVCATDAGLEARIDEQTVLMRWIDSLERWEMITPLTFQLEYGGVYYFRARVYDSLGRVSPWSIAARETAGDTLAPSTPAPQHIDITSQGHVYTATINGNYTQADDHDYYEWWVNTSNNFPGGDGVRENDREFIFGNKSGSTVYLWVAAVDRSGNRSSGYTTSVANVPFVPQDFWIETGNVTDTSGDPIVDITDRDVVDENGNTVFSFNSGSGITDYNAVLEGAINFGTGGALHLTDNTVSFAATPIVGMEIIARGLKLYQDSNNYIIMEKDGSASVNFEVVGGTIKTSGGTSYVEMDSTGIKGYNSSTQRFELNADGSGWLGGSSDFYWDTSGNVTIAGTVTVTNIAATTGTIANFTIATNSLTSTNIGIHSAGYGEGAEILLGHATAYASAVTGFKQDGSGKVANNNFYWDASGNVTMAGDFTSTATITGGTIQTASSGARVVLSSAGLDAYNATVQTVDIGSDGSGWFGLTGTRAIEWTTAGAVTIADWDILSDRIRKTFDTDHYLTLNTSAGEEAVYFIDSSPGTGDVRWCGFGKLHDGSSFTSEEGFGLVLYNGATYDKYFWVSGSGAEIAGWEFTEELLRSDTSSNSRIELNATENRVSIFATTNEKVAMGYLDGVVRNNASGTATGGSTTYLDDSGQDWETDVLIGLTINITSGTGAPQSRTITDNTPTRINASFSPAVGAGSVYNVTYPSNYYGFWAASGDELRIDGDVTYDSGDWIIHNDGSLRIINNLGNEIIRLGTDTGDKGLFIYDQTVGPTTQLAKFVDDEIYIGTAGDYLQYTTAGGLVIEGNVTITNYPAQPFDEDAYIIFPLDSFPIDQSGNDNDGSTSYGANVTYVDGGVGGGYAALFPDGTGAGDYHFVSTPYSLGEMTITWWSKCTDTAANPVFDHGSSVGLFNFNVSSLRPRLYLSSTNYRYWVDRSEQDDGEWHFWLLYIAGSGTSDITNAELWVDNTEITTDTTVSSGSPTAFGNLRLGLNFDGYMQDFRVYNRELTSSEKTAVYTNPMTRTSTRITGDKIRTGTIESNNWGSSTGSQFNLDDGEFYLGGSSSPDLSFSSGTLTVTGTIHITGSSDGFSNLTDIGDLDDLSGTPATGLYLTNSYIGYYSSGVETNYIAYDGSGKFASGDISWTSGGDFLLGDQVNDAYIFWDQSTSQLILGQDVEMTFASRLVSGTNIMAPDVRLWHETTTPETDDDMGYFTDGSNPYGGDDNNNVISALNPWGQRDLIWECVPTTSNTNDGGWQINSPFTIDRDLRYRYSAWVKQIGDNDGGFYFGLQNSATHTSNLTANGSDDGNANPYFRSNSSLRSTIYFSTTAITNGTMEADANWTAFNSPTTEQRSATQAHGGTYSWQITVNGERQGIYSDVFTVDGYLTYKVGIWLYGDGNEWSVYVDDGTETHYIKDFGSEVLTPISGEWTHHVLHFQPKARSTTARIYIVSAEDHTGTLYVDDVDLYSNLIVNGDIEESDTTQTAFSGWAHVGTPTYCERSTTQAHSGTYSWRITVNAANEGVQTSRVQVANGSATSTSSGNLVDSGASFDTDGTAAGDKVYNNTDNTCTTIDAVTNGTTLDLANDIFTSGEAYIISSDESYIKLIAGYQYRCSIWLYGNGSTTWQAKVSDGTNDYDFLETDNTTTLVPAASWTNYILDFEASANSDTAYIEITSIGTSGTLYIDDVTLQDTPWYLFIGYLHPSGYAGTESWGGVYHYKSGLKDYLTFTDFKSMSTATSQEFRLMYYDSDVLTNRQYQYGPSIHVVDGSEPTLSAMLGNSMDTGWNIEGTTNISKYLVSSPTIRGGDYANGNYVQIDETGINAFGSYVNTFKVDSTDGSVTIRSSGSGQKVEIDGTTNSLNFYRSDGTKTVELSEDLGGLGNDSGFRIRDSEGAYFWVGTATNENYIQYNAGTGSYKIVYDEPGFTFAATSALRIEMVSGNVTDRLTTDSYAAFIRNEDNNYTDDAIERYGAWIMSEVNWSTKTAVGALIEGEHNDTTGEAVGVWGYAYGTSTGDHVALQGECDDIALRLMRADDNGDKCDFDISASGDLNITPSGGSIVLWESAGALYDYTTLWTDTSGIFNVQPQGTNSTGTGYFRLWDALGASGDYADFYVNSSGVLNIVPNGTGAGTGYLRLWDAAEGSLDYTDIWTDANADLNIKPQGDDIYIWESAGGAGNYGRLYANTSGNFVIQGGSGNTVYIDDNFNVSGTYSRGGTVIVDASRNCDFNNVNADGSFQMDGSDIITSAGLQTGVFRTIIPIVYGLSGIITNNDYMHGPGGVDNQQVRLPYDATLLAVTIRTNGAMTIPAGDTIDVLVEVAEGDSDVSYATANSSLVLTNSDNGNAGKGSTGQTTAFSAGDAVRIQLYYTITTGPSLNDPIVTLWFLMKAS